MNTELEEFNKLLKKTVEYLNDDATRRSEYYLSRGGTKLEDDIFNVISDLAKGSPFEGKVKLISSQTFPDIVVADIYGVEVKTSKSKNWTSTGSSIVESTRIKSVEHVFLLFGKLVDPVHFMVKPYEECLSEIVVTHSPRYKIDMNLKQGDTIFEKMDVDYNSFRNSDKNIKFVQDYYRSKLKDGQELWWLANNDELEEDSISPIIKMWNTLSSQDKKQIRAEGFVRFPEIFSKNNQQKYNGLGLWLVKHKGVVSASLRDTYTAGGKENIVTINGKYNLLPQIFYQLYTCRQEVREMLQNTDPEALSEIWNCEIGESTLEDWVQLASEHYQNGDRKIKEIIRNILITP